jgi:hypothetical protein
MVAIQSIKVFFCRDSWFEALHVSKGRRALGESSREKDLEFQ